MGGQRGLPGPLKPNQTSFILNSDLEMRTMKIHQTAMTLALALLSALASAQTTVTPQTVRAEQVLQRDVNQETRIRDGLQSGQLTTREAALLQREEAHIDRLQRNALADGNMSKAEAARINAAQNKVSADIYTADHNGISGNPLSASSQPMQAATQRDINQQKRIRDGVAQGQLTNREASRLEAGQARTDSQEFLAGRDGDVGAAEATRANHAQNKQSTHIHNLRHSAAVSKG
jgi:hypothetical protein